MTTKHAVIGLCILFLTTACTGPTVRSTYSQTVDFSHYKTFGFFDPLDTDTRYESLNSQYLKQATVAEMTQRGFVLSKEQPDLLINFHSQTEDKQTLHQFPSPTYRAAYYGYRGQFYYDTWVNYQTFIDDYQEGTLTIDLVDTQLKKMIWQGVAIDRVTEDKLKNLQATLQHTVSEIFRQFPVSVQP